MSRDVAGDRGIHAVVREHVQRGRSVRDVRVEIFLHHRSSFSETARVRFSEIARRVVRCSAALPILAAATQRVATIDANHLSLFVNKNPAATRSFL